MGEQMRVILFFLFSFFLLSASSEASPIIKIKVVFVTGDNWVGVDNSRLITRQLRRYLDANISEDIRVFYGRISGLSAASPDSQLLLARQYSSQSELDKKYDVVHYVFPPYLMDGVLYIGGMSYVCSIKCPGKNSSVSNAEVYSSTTGADRLRHSMIAAAHEIGHALGASHLNSKTLMNYQVLGFADGEVKVDKQSLKQINQCIGG